ncbi:uncharacterized protein LOC123705047 isoform X2 [Colias croceus]|uniref:uncharacterized protein LOC123705047 isoform X2 n=1 Tax=Colias crocea TaxID=72248 RepID=UPI001E27DE94|nr:uncharacterized protein LOC123705047 isoform X2 [Colias croceus]
MSFRNYYDSSSYNRNRDAGRSTINTATERPASLTTKYTTTSSIKTSSIPVLSDRNAREETPISAIANRYASYNKTNIDKSHTPTTSSKYEKKDYSKLSIPSVSTNKSREVSPVSSTSKYKLNRHSRQASPERKTSKGFKEKCKDNGSTERDKDIPTKTEKSSGYSSLSNYKLYPRSVSYTRPVSRADSKPEINYNRTTTRTETKPEINYTRPTTRNETKSEINFSRPTARSEIKPEITVNRYAIANRLSSSSYLRSPTPVKRPSVSPVNHIEIPKHEPTKPVLPNIIVEENNLPQRDVSDVNNKDKNQIDVDDDKELETVTVITRHTSPTPPGSSSYVRIRRADLAKTIEKIITRKKKRPEAIDKEIQSDRLDDPTRTSRFAGTSRTSVTNWTYYSPNINSYTGYAGRYSTQYSTLRDNSNSYRDRCSRSRSKEPVVKESTQEETSANMQDNECNDQDNRISDFPQDVINIYENNKDDETSEIIINVNLKLKKARSPSAVSMTELVSPEITITNNQLPPQPPKPEGTSKIKKGKGRKSSTDSTDSNSTKKLKRRSKSVSSTDSDQGSEKGSCSNASSSNNITKNLKKTKIQNGPQSIKHYKSRDSNSPESSLTLSSSISEDENASKSKTNDISRTSADETSLPTDTSNKHSSTTASHKNENGTEEAKSFLIRALAPVTNLFKLRHQDSSDNNKWIDNSTSDSTSKDVSTLLSDNAVSKNKCHTDNVVASNEDNLVKLKGIRRIESGERSWWLESENSNKSNTDTSTYETANENKNESQLRQLKKSESNDSKRSSKKCLFIDEEKPWWLDSNANIPEGIERLTPPRKSSSEDDRTEEKNYNFYKLRQMESGEQKDWFLSSNDSSSKNNKTDSPNNLSLSKSGSDQKTFPFRRIRHIESGERPWWLSSDKNIPEGIEKLPTPPPQEESDSSDSEEVEVYMPSSQIPPFPLHLPDDEPLGDRRSPEGLETPNYAELYRDRSSPYENNCNYRSRNNLSYSKGAKYISRYTDIDDILGNSNQIYSPFVDSILAKRTNHNISYDDDDDDECEEIDPTQVRIHDSTAQMPVIRKVHSRNDLIDYDDEDQLDDATLQVFKDGDYGPYLDLDSTLGEQDEELEGLQESRKNALVLRTQLSVKVHAIIERLLHSQGKELRKALFTVKQMLKSEKDLVHEFVANDGLDCLMQISAKEDPTYLDYILRVIGQILIYVDGMHGVMDHKGCIQWLYSLTASNFRHVVKTTLKLLSIFVEYTETNSLLLIDAINFVDKSNGRPAWYNIIKILQDFDASDTELLICATNLINICLINIPDKNMYYDQVDTLQDQGIDDIIHLYMSKQGTDLDLLRQLQIFEAVLMYEDGDDTDTAIKQLDDSIIKSMRRRNINLPSTETRKSKKYQMKEKGNQRYTSGLKQRIQNGTLGHSVNACDALAVIRQKQLDINPEKPDRGIILNREHSIKDLAQRLTSPISHVPEDKPIRVSDMAGIVSKAKEELAKSQSKEIIKSPTIEKSPKLHEIKVSENDLHWEELKKGCLNREFHLCDLDFSDLRQDSDDDMMSPAVNAANGPPPPPPSMLPSVGVPPPLPGYFPTLTKTKKFHNQSLPAELLSDSDTSTIRKNKKTVKLFWREIQETPFPTTVREKVGGFIWDDLPEVNLDTAMLEHLFESRTNDLIIKEKLMEPKRNLILDAKRSNAINIAMKKLPTPQTIKAAIMKMDATVIGREGIEKLLTMLPTEEEKVKIQEAQYANPDLPLGSAEQFLLTLASINELPSRLKLWVFKLDFDNLEKEIAEPLMDLKQGIELLKANRTFKVILSTLRSVGSFLNGSQVKGFRLEYLSKVMEVKDTVHKHPLLYHICEMIKEKFSDTTDFFSEVGPVIRASKVDFDVLSNNLLKLEADCKASWDHMKKVAKHDGTQIYKTKINDFITDAAERIILLTLIKKRVMSRYNKFLLYLGVPPADIPKTRPSEFLKVIAEFALEYRTTRERVLQQLEKRANHRERNKTRGKMIIDIGKYSTKGGDHTADNALKELLKTDADTDILTEGRRKSQPCTNKKILVNGDISAVEEIIESLVRSKPSTARDRRRNRISDKKNFNRTLDGHSSWPGRESSDGSTINMQQR